MVTSGTALLILIGVIVLFAAARLLKARLTATLWAVLAGSPHF